MPAAAAPDRRRTPACQRTSRGDIVVAIVDVDDLVCGQPGRANARVEELNSGLACTNSERQDQFVEQPQDRLELPAEPLEVQLVGVARQHESRTARFSRTITSSMSGFGVKMSHQASAIALSDASN